MVDPLFFLSLSVPQQRALFRSMCEQNQWYWPQVSRVLRREAITAHSSRHAGDAVEWTLSNIPIYTDCFAEPQPLCSFKRKCYDIGFRIVGYRDQDCDSPSERRCGPRLADELLQRVKTRITLADKIYIAEADLDSGLLNRMSQRRHAGRYETFTYIDVDGKVSFVANGPIQGTSHPRSSERASKDETIEWLTPRLWVPGYVNASFSDGWAFRSEPTVSSGSQISLDGLSLNPPIGPLEMHHDALGQVQ